jgi:hypothetical protein
VDSSLITDKGRDISAALKQAVCFWMRMDPMYQVCGQALEEYLEIYFTYRLLELRLGCNRLADSC